MLLLIFGQLAPRTAVTPAQFRIGDKPRLVRYEYIAQGEALRATEIMDTAQAGERRLVSATLLSSGELRFVRMIEIDKHANRHIETIINTKGQKAAFRRGPDSDLTEDESSRGMGVLTIGGASVKITPKDAETATGRRRVRAMLTAWDPAELKGLAILYKKTVSCGMLVGKGVLLPIMLGEPAADGCEPGMVETRPDPRRDQEFLAIVPELVEWLRTPATLMTRGHVKR